MFADLQMFVPAKAFAAQMMYFAAGFLWLAASPSRWSRSMVVAAAYPVGAVIAGIVQWLAFEFGAGNWAVHLWSASTALVVIRFVAARWNGRVKPGREEHAEAGLFHDSWSVWFGWAVIIAAAVVGFVVAQSSDVGETDPRWQIAYRAKIVANTSGYDTPYFQSRDVAHINPKYPLAFSAISAMTMRLTGDRMSGTSLRAVSFAFFVSFLLLLAAYAVTCRNVAGALVAGLVVLCSPKVWALAVAENYTDFPLGVLAMTWILLLVFSARKGISLSLAVVSVGMAGFKTEGMALLGCLALAVIRWGFRRHGRWRAICYAGAAVLFIGAGLAVYWFGLQQVPSSAPMENVQFSDISFSILRENFTRIGTILRSFLLDHTFCLPEFGLFFPLVIVSALLARGPLRGCVVRASGFYLALLMLPFLFSPWCSVEVHLRYTVSRFLCQVLPMLAIVIAEGAGQADVFIKEVRNGLNLWMF